MHSARVLVVEDEALVAAALDSCLRNLGHQVAASTARGEDAVRKAVALDPDLILMDIRLQGALDGIEAAHRINQCLKIPIVYLTAHSDEQTLLRARVTEPYGFVLKPFDEQSLKSVIEITLYRAAVQGQVRRSRARLLAILDGIGEAVLVTDLKGESPSATRRPPDCSGAGTGKCWAACSAKCSSIWTKPGPRPYCR